jgi:hypothetical protein
LRIRVGRSSYPGSEDISARDRGPDAAFKDLPMCLLAAVLVGVCGNELYFDHIDYHQPVSYGQDLRSVSRQDAVEVRWTTPCVGPWIVPSAVVRAAGPENRLGLDSGRS